MILCIDPEADELAATREALEAGGFRTCGAASVAEVNLPPTGTHETDALGKTPDAGDEPTANDD